MTCTSRKIDRRGYGTFWFRVDADHVEAVVAEKARIRERSRRDEIAQQTREAA